MAFSARRVVFLVTWRVFWWWNQEKLCCLLSPPTVAASFRVFALFFLWQKKRLATESLEANCKTPAFRKLFPELVELHERRKADAVAQRKEVKRRGERETKQSERDRNTSRGTPRFTIFFSLGHGQMILVRTKISATACCCELSFPSSWLFLHETKPRFVLVEFL